MYRPYGSTVCHDPKDLRPIHHLHLFLRHYSTLRPSTLLRLLLSAHSPERRHRPPALPLTQPRSLPRPPLHNRTSTRGIHHIAPPLSQAHCVRPPLVPHHIDPHLPLSAL